MPCAVPVDVELVIAVDVSYSMDPKEQALQREGYVMALTSREFLRALREGANGKIAVTYFEWAGQSDQKIIMPWRLIDGPVRDGLSNDASSFSNIFFFAIFRVAISFLRFDFTFRF